MSKMRIVAIVVIVLVSAGSASWIGSSQKHAGHSRGAASKYYCPMHPQVISDKPGDCPICHMRLVPAKDESAPVKNKSDGRKLLFYRHPMNPKITSQVPAKDEMGMDYVPVYSDEISKNAGKGMEGYAGVTISPEKQQLIGIKTSLVETKELHKEIVTVGKIAYDPDLYQAQTEYIQAAKALRQPENATKTLSKQWAESVIQSARKKLILMGLNEDMIKFIGENEAPDDRLLFGNAGQESWVYANIYEYEIPSVKVGDIMEVRASAIPDPLLGEIKAIDAIVDPMTRSVRVRGTVKNENGWLKPDMYVNVILRLKLGTVTAVPEEAVLQSGTRSIVFVEKEDGYFEPRQVTLGQKAAGFYEVKKGLTEGERVVSNGNFFVDSESRLKAALSGMSGGPDS